MLILRTTRAKTIFFKNHAANSGCFYFDMKSIEIMLKCDIQNKAYI